MRRLALTLALVAAACGDGAGDTIVTFSPPPGFDVGTELLTVREDGVPRARYILRAGETFDRIEAGVGATLEALLFDEPPELLLVRSGPVDEGRLRLPTPRAGFSATLAETVSSWEPTPLLEATPSVAFACPALTWRRIEIGQRVAGRIVGVVAQDDGSALFADRRNLFALRDGRVELVATTTRAIDRLVVDGTPFVGLDGRYVARLTDPAQLTLADAYDLGHVLDDVAANDAGTAAYAISERGTVARLAEGTWEHVDPGRTSDGRQRLLWVGNDEVLGMARASVVQRWRRGVRSEEALDEALEGAEVVAGVATGGRTLVLAKSGTAARHALERIGDVWTIAFSFDEAVIQDITHGTAHPFGLFYGGQQGPVGFMALFGGRDVEACPVDAFTNDDIRGMAFLPPNQLVVIAGESQLWTIEVVP